MKAHAFCQPVRHVERFVKTIGEKVEQFFTADTNFIRVVRPVNEQAAPYHNRQYREVDPVKPADGKRMLFENGFHAGKVT